MSGRKILSLNVHIWKSVHYLEWIQHIWFVPAVILWPFVPPTAILAAQPCVLENTTVGDMLDNGRFLGAIRLFYEKKQKQNYKIILQMQVKVIMITVSG